MANMVVRRKAAPKAGWVLVGFRVPPEVKKRMTEAKSAVNWTASLGRAVEEILRQAGG